MGTYLLVHARWFGAWCWDEVAARLRRAGHTVHAPDRADVAELRARLDRAPEPVHLVGHSSSGMTISALAEAAPGAVARLTYVAAFLLPNGTTPPDIARDDADSVLAGHLVVDRTHGTVTVADPEAVFFHDCAPADAARAAARLTPEPLAPPRIPPTTLTEARFGRVPRVYVECTADRALSPAAQRRMYTRVPCARVHRLPTGHAPFLAAPDRLATALAAPA